MKFYRRPFKQEDDASLRSTLKLTSLRAERKIQHGIGSKSDPVFLRAVALQTHHGTMILDGVCHSAIPFGRVILPRVVEPSRSSSFK